MGGLERKTKNFAFLRSGEIAWIVEHIYETGFIFSLSWCYRAISRILTNNISILKYRSLSDLQLPLGLGHHVIPKPLIIKISLKQGRL